MAKDDRLRVPVEEDYITALGLASYCYARLEWDAIYVIQRIGENGHNPKAANYIDKLGKKTGGTIAQDLLKFVNGIVHPVMKNNIEPHALEYGRVVTRRNDLLHAIPGTIEGGGQRLVRHGTPWSVEDMENIADEFTACSSALNNLYHNVL